MPHGHGAEAGTQPRAAVPHECGEEDTAGGGCDPWGWAEELQHGLTWRGAAAANDLFGLGKNGGLEYDSRSVLL